MDDQMAADILERCRSVRYLAIWSYIDPHRDSFSHLQAVLTSRRLCPIQISLSQFILSPWAESNRSFTHPILIHITHMDIPYQEKGEWDWGSLELLQSLTHLSIDVYHWEPAQVARDAVQWCPDGLRVLIICISWDWLASCDERDDVKSLVRGDVDPRIVAISFRSNLPSLELNFRLSFEELLDGWKRPSISSKLWDAAEQVVNQRRMKYSNETSCSCESSFV